jgi:hypothetical protein
MFISNVTLYYTIISISIIITLAYIAHTIIFDTEKVFDALALLFTVIGVLVVIAGFIILAYIIFINISYWPYGSHGV